MLTRPSSGQEQTKTRELTFTVRSPHRRLLGGRVLRSSMIWNSRYRSNVEMRVN
jgi:hypothetical protein